MTAALDAGFFCDLVQPAGRLAACEAKLIELFRALEAMVAPDDVTPERAAVVAEEREGEAG